MTTSSTTFDVPMDTVVVTTSYVTQRRMPILSVSHDEDETEGIVWQFHCGNGDLEPSVLQLVRLDEILELDASLLGLANLPVGYRAERAGPGAPWTMTKE